MLGKLDMSLLIQRGVLFCEWFGGSVISWYLYKISVIYLLLFGSNNWKEERRGG